MDLMSVCGRPNIVSFPIDRYIYVLGLRKLKLV